MGAYDEDEHEKREQQIGEVDEEAEDDRKYYEGDVEYDSDESVEELVDKLKDIKSE